MMLKSVLLVDDDESNASLISICMEESGEKAYIRHVKTAEEALDYMNGKGAYFDRKQNPIPAVIMLDLRLPKMSGLEFLEKIKQCHEFLSVPVAVLTAMESPNDIKKALSSHANSCMVKPFGLESMKSLIRCFAVYWIKYNRLPENRAQ
jgi:CheY-like chemotaxis protein